MTSIDNSFDQEFRRIFSVLMNGSPAEFKVVKREINKLWNKDSALFKKSAHIAFEYIDKFDTIKSSKNQAAFASGLNLFFLVLSDENFEILKSFVLKLIQSDDGHIRESIRKTASWLHISLSSRISPFVYPSGKALTSLQEKERIKAKKQYFSYTDEIELLIDKYDDCEDNVEYVNEMKPSIQKSLQMLLGEVTYGEHRFAGEIASQKIVVKRKEIDAEFLNFLEKTKSDFDVDDIREVIYNEDGTDDMTKIVAMFDTGQGAVELEDIMETIINAWNYFPHKDLGGKCPMQMLEKSKQ